MKQQLNNIMNPNFDAFSHGQTISKIWLCENLEPHISKNTKVAILGSWYNILSFMMLSRQPNIYKRISGVDINPEAISMADKICNAWTMGSNYIVENIIADANTYDISSYDVVVNCSPEHMISNEWFENIEYGTLVCIQTSDVTDPDYPWLVSNPNKDLNTLIEKYPLSQHLFTGTKEINYADWGYKRFMIIGLK